MKITDTEEVSTIIFDDPTEDTSTVVISDLSSQVLDLSNMVSNIETSKSGSYVINDENFYTFINVMPLITIIIDEYNNIVCANNKAKRYADKGGLPNLENLSIHALIPEQLDAKLILQTIDQVFETKRPMSTSSLLKFGKKIIWSKTIYTPMRINQGRFLLCVIQDLSREKLAQHRLQEEHKKTAQAQKEAVEAMTKAAGIQLVREVAAGVAHNFNNLLQVITSAASVIELTDDREKINKYATQILEASEKGKLTVERLAEYARSMSYTGEHRMVHMSRLVDNCIEYTRPFWHNVPRKGGYTIDVVPDIQPNLYIVGLENELSEVIINLIKNSCEAMPEGGTLRVSLKAGMGSILLQISDTGVGIPKSLIPKLFAPFFTTKGTAGTGMGLASSRQIIERHNGSISVSSNPHELTTFTIALPDAS